MLQNQMRADLYDDDVSFHTFKDRCIRIYHAITQLQLRKGENGGNRRFAASGMSSFSGATSSANPKVKTESLLTYSTSTYVSLSATERAALMRAGASVAKSKAT
jgi:hypothetical protein